MPSRSHFARKREAAGARTREDREREGYSSATLGACTEELLFFDTAPRRWVKRKAFHGCRALYHTPTNALSEHHGSMNDALNFTIQSHNMSIEF